MTKDVLKMHAKSLIDMFKDQKALYGAEMARVLEPKTAIILSGLGQKKASAASAIPGHDKGSPGRKVTSNPPPPPPPFRLWCARFGDASPRDEAQVQWLLHSLKEQDPRHAELAAHGQTRPQKRRKTATLPVDSSPVVGGVV